MKDKFNELYEIAKLDRKKSPWSRARSFESRLKELKSEVAEAEEAYKSGDVEHLKDEMGDVFFDAMFLIVLAEEKGYFEGKEVFESMLAKYKRRKPWVFEDENIDEAEEQRRWNAAKAKEKLENSINKKDD